MSVREILLMIDPLTVVVNTIVDKVATGESSAGVEYITTSSSELSKTGGTGAAGQTSTISVGSGSSSSSSSSGSGSSGSSY